MHKELGREQLNSTTSPDGTLAIFAPEGGSYVHPRALIAAAAAAELQVAIRLPLAARSMSACV